MPKNRIKELAARAGVSTTDLARRIDMNAPALRRYLRHETQPKTELAERIAAALGCTINEVLGFDQNGGPPARETPQTQIPLYGNAAAGEGADVSDVTAPIEYIEQHPAMSGSSVGYAVFVIGTSMEPRFREGEIVYIKPGKPPRRGDDVVVQIEDAGSRQRYAIVKQFISNADGTLTLGQFNPEREIQFDSKTVLAIHCVCGTFIS